MVCEEIFVEYVRGDDGWFHIVSGKFRDDDSTAVMRGLNEYCGVYRLADLRWVVLDAGVIYLPIKLIYLGREVVCSCSVRI